MKRGVFMKNREFIIIHGLNGSPTGHWQDFLFNYLINNNETVHFLDFPNKDKPELELWLAHLQSYEKNLHENTIVIAHSMGVILWLHYINRFLKTKIKKLILVAPPSNEFLLSSKKTESFADFQLNKKNLHSSAQDIVMIATNNDNYCIQGAESSFAKILEIPFIELPMEARHINIDSGYGEWDLIQNLAINS